jgi:hypothetical protein
MNLMMNSIDAMKNVDGTRELTIQSQRGDDGQVVISVSDTGVGLPPQKAEQIFDAFFTTKPHGTGMGLRISRSIVESNGGHLWAADNSPRGARFFFTLPTNGETRDSAMSDPGPGDGLHNRSRLHDLGGRSRYSDLKEAARAEVMGAELIRSGPEYAGTAAMGRADRWRDWI